MTYILVTWPHSQLLQTTSWFSECILMNDENHVERIGYAAYFVPEERYREYVVFIQSAP